VPMISFGFLLFGNKHPLDTLSPTVSFSFPPLFDFCLPPSQRFLPLAFSRRSLSRKDQELLVMEVEFFFRICIGIPLSVSLTIPSPPQDTRSSFDITPLVLFSSPSDPLFSIVFLDHMFRYRILHHIPFTIVRRESSIISHYRRLFFYGPNLLRPLLPSFLVFNSFFNAGNALSPRDNYFSAF